MDSLPDLVSKLPLGIQYTLAALVLLVSLVQSGKFLWRWLMRKLWPWTGRNDWGAECQPLRAGHENEGRPLRDPNRAWQGGSGSRWSSMAPQTYGMWWRLYIGKGRSRRPRVLSQIRLRHGPDPGFPAHYQLKTKEQDEQAWCNRGRLLCYG